MGCSTFVVDGKRLILVEQIVTANVTEFGRTVTIIGFHLDDLIGLSSFVHVHHVRRLIEFRCILVDIVDADVDCGAVNIKKKVANLKK